jgi:hypothetical protein
MKTTYPFRASVFDWKIRKPVTEAEENAPKLGPFPFFSSRQQHIAPQKVNSPY